MQLLPSCRAPVVSTPATSLCLPRCRAVRAVASQRCYADAAGTIANSKRLPYGGSGSFVEDMAGPFHSSACRELSCRDGHSWPFLPIQCWHARPEAENLTLQNSVPRVSSNGATTPSRALRRFECRCVRLLPESRCLCPQGRLGGTGMTRELTWLRSIMCQTDATD